MKTRREYGGYTVKEWAQIVLYGLLCVLAGCVPELIKHYLD